MKQTRVFIKKISRFSRTYYSDMEYLDESWTDDMEGWRRGIGKHSSILYSFNGIVV